MATSFGEWMMRMVMLVLAGLVTLSLLGALAAMSNSAALDIAVERPRASVPVAAPAERPAPTAPTPATPADAGRAADLRSAPQENDMAREGAAAPERTSRWLEAIAYALLALAGLLGLAILLLWRGLRQLRRLADAAETRRN